MGKPDTPEMRILVDVLIDEPAWSAADTDWELLADRSARATLAQAQADGTALPPSVEISLLLTGDARQQALNRDHRGLDRPTNVLSFPQAAEPGVFPPDMAVPLGDISLAWGVVAREAAAGSLTVRDHATHLMVHGILHLLGYDHEKDADASQMEGLETAALARLGIADPYAVDQTDKRTDSGDGFSSSTDHERASIK